MPGHSELSAHAKHMRDDSDGGTHASLRIAWLMVLNPVDLFRLTVVAPSPALASSVVPRLAPTAMAWAWILWIGMPAAIGLYRFRRMHIP